MEGWDGQMGRTDATDGWVDGWTGGRVDGWTGGLVDGQIYRWMGGQQTDDLHDLCNLQALFRLAFVMLSMLFGSLEPDVHIRA